MRDSPIVVTLDLDWACEAAIVDVLDWLHDAGIPVTVFTTHHSAAVASQMDELEVGLHPFFAPDSSHGSSTAEVVRHVLDLPHNIPAFRCHRFAVSNEARQAMSAVGMTISSNVCTDLECVAPFRDRFGMLEVPIFLEDGGYLYRGHSLDSVARVIDLAHRPGPKVVVVHPMHFAVNTPRFDYMMAIKSSVSRGSWRELADSSLAALRWRGRGVRDFLCDFLQEALKRGGEFIRIGDLARRYGERSEHPAG
ncbi:MAG: hypothetical protein IPK80_15185 [Nannocystis sp.]|nr:hypothetical protein [Nannocystis sp.]